MLESLPQSGGVGAGRAEASGERSMGGTRDVVKPADIPWSKLVGAHYLLRFLVHFPQLAHVLASNTPGGRNAKVGDVIVRGIVPVVEDLLVYLDELSESLGV